MLAMADEYGIVHAALPGIANRARVSMEECHTAINTLEGPDPQSKSSEWDGRRIERIEGGWLLLNYAKYREIQNKKQRDGAERQRRYRVKKQRDVSQMSRDVTHGNALSRDVTTEAEAEAEAKAKKNYLGPQVAQARKQFQSVYPGRKGSQRWPKARKQFDVLVRKGVDPGVLVGKAQSYATFCVLDGKIGTEYVMQAATFLGEGGGWEEDWIAKIEAEPPDRFEVARRKLEAAQ